ncbi:MAG: DUF3047 domain-containing protein [Alphaproteobacteria bacterium]|nr:DUF3047 domain-containing protein [Alphaproteobacteria bacterium]
MPPSANAASDRVVDQWTQWKQHSFHGNTVYTSQDDGSLKAQCNNSASALFREISIDLTKTPVLRWSWKIDGVHPELQERTKSGDDYPARVYVVYTPSVFMPWRTLAINYVWSNNQPVGTVWPNAFTSQAMMIALRSGVPRGGAQWQSESRNVRDDFRRYFGVDIKKIDGVAIMTDCDNAGRPMTGYYNNIRFSRE